MTRLVLIRHGEAQSWVDGIVGGDQGCTGLSDLGRRQAIALRDRLARTGELGTVDALYASTLPRALETAEIIAPALGDPPIKQERELREFDPGEAADGRTWEDYEREYPRELWDAYRSRSPGAESWAQFGVRIGAALRDVAERHAGGTVVVACHGGVIEQSVVNFFGLGHHGELASFDIANTSLTEWVRPDPDEVWWRPGGQWRLLRLNDAAHLEGVGGGHGGPPPVTSIDPE
ncbi:MAG TPA: histidine phosphatase family protein [Acidimicrobiales bacterium]|nr:histidine phosphatase family protein [Acidimicrobiales bacterium]